MTASPAHFTMNQLLANRVLFAVLAAEPVEMKAGESVRAVLARGDVEKPALDYIFMVSEQGETAVATDVAAPFAKTFFIRLPWTSEMVNGMAQYGKDPDDILEDTLTKTYKLKPDDYGMPTSYQVASWMKMTGGTFPKEERALMLNKHAYQRLAVGLLGVMADSEKGRLIAGNNMPVAVYKSALIDPTSSVSKFITALVRRAEIGEADLTALQDYARGLESYEYMARLRDAAKGTISFAERVQAGTPPGFGAAI
jgi:hypothetical protein